jgi:3-oxoadipate enol-lactonase
MTSSDDPALRPTRTVDLGDHTTGVWDSGGDGIPMLLVHCLALDKRVWREVYPRLAHVGRTIAYDLRNHGSARGAPLVRDLDHVADDAARLLDELGVERADVFGASYGGAIAQHLVLRHPDRVRSLALIATSPWCPTEVLDERATNAEANGMDAQVAESLIRWFAPETIAEDGWAVRYARTMIREDRVAEWAASWRAMARLDVVARLGEIQVPTVAIAGQQDRSAVPEALEAIADGVPDCRYVLVDPGTHMMPMEQPGPLADALVAFRSEIDG